MYSGTIVDVVVDTVEIAGHPRTREVIRHPGGVVVLGILEDGRIPFVRQHRYPMNRFLLELPAGKLDPGEEPRESARREMEEETGFLAESLELVSSFYTSPGFCDELLHCYYSDKLRPTARRLDEDEEIELEFHTLEDALVLAEQGEIVDGKTLLALYWLSALAAPAAESEAKAQGRSGG